jgi:hypothetical protein
VIGFGDLEIESGLCFEKAEPVAPATFERVELVMIA